VRFVVYGAGAVGGTIGGRLFESGHDVVLIARGDHYSALAASGLLLESPEDSVVLPVPVVDHPGALTFGPDDVILLTMKTQDSAVALDSLASCGVSDHPVISAQNGVANEALALRRFPNVYGMCVMLPAIHLSPGVVRAGAAPVTGVLDVGRYPLGSDSLASSVASALAASTFLSVPDPVIMRRKYRKLLMNLGNALNAACGSGGSLYQQAVLEGEACLHAAGIDYCTEEEDKQRRKGMSPMTYPDGFRHGSSTWQSLERKAGTTEADYLNGEIVLLGRLHGVPTPVNVVLQRVAARMARLGMAPGSFKEDDLLAEVDAEVARSTVPSGR
jgi:2-dehydropantoate 2-reductase